MSDNPDIRPLGDPSSRETFSKKFCPLIKESCRKDCMLLGRSQEKGILQCSFSIIADQLDILAKG